MKLIIDIPDTEYQIFKVACNHGIGNTAMERILNGKPIKQGHWIKDDSEDIAPIWKKIRVCSNCAYLQFNETNYCPNCGAKMAESEEG